MRSRVLLEWFEQMAPEQIYAFLEWVAERVAVRNGQVMKVLEAVNRAVLESQENPPLYESMADVYRIARSRENPSVISLLLNAAPQRGPVGPNELRGDLQLSKLTLGERKFLARGRDRARLERLLLDSSPDVIRNLLKNPALTEQDVVRLAARRPTRDSIQREIFLSRFGNRYAVRVALVCNPYTPTEISLKLLGFLLKSDLKLVRSQKGLHPLVIEQAKRLLKEKSFNSVGRSETDSTS